MMTLDKEQRITLWKELIDAIEAYVDGVAEQDVSPGFDPTTVRSLLSGFDFSEPVAPVDALRFAIDGMRTQQVHSSHPRYFGLFNPAPTTMGVAADTLVAAFNPQLAAWSHSPFACELEQHLIHSIGAHFGYKAPALAGSFTSGGSEANHSALITALVHHFPDYAARGARGIPGPPALYVSAETHLSMLKAARMCGIGSEAVRIVGDERSGRLDPDALSDRIREDRRSGCCPFMVVATLGSTNTGVLDPIAAIADVCEAEDVWLHADAAWGGVATIVPELRPYFDGIERADSITVDAHKWLSVPMSAGVHLTRHPDILEQTFGFHAEFMPTDAEGMAVRDPYLHSMQWSRRFIGLKVFLSLAVAGWDGYRELVRRQTSLGNRLRHRLIESGWEIVNETPLPLVCFIDSRVPEGGSEKYLRALSDTIVRSGRAWISTTRLADSRPAIRACITNHRTQPEDVDGLVSDLEWARGRVSGQTSATCR